MNKFGQCEVCGTAYRSEERICDRCTETGGKIIDLMEVLGRALGRTAPRVGATEQGEGTDHE